MSSYRKKNGGPLLGYQGKAEHPAQTKSTAVKFNKWSCIESSIEKKREHFWDIGNIYSTSMA